MKWFNRSRKEVPFGIPRHPLERGLHAAHDQQLDAVVRRSLRQFRTEHHRLHRLDARAANTVAGPADTADHEDAGTAAEDEGAAGKVQGQGQGRQATALEGDDAPVPRDRCQPRWLSRSARYPDADLDRAIQGYSEVRPANPGRPRQPVRSLLLVEPGAGHRSARQSVCRNGPGRLRSVRARSAQLRAPCAGGRIYVGPAEDDDAPVGRSAAGSNEPDHALDDADHVRVLHAAVPGRTGHIHPVLKPHWGCNSVFCRWQETNNDIREAVRVIRRGRKCGRTRYDAA